MQIDQLIGVGGVTSIIVRSFALVVHDFERTNVVVLVDNDSLIRRTAVFLEVDFDMHFFHAQLRGNRNLFTLN